MIHILYPTNKLKDYRYVLRQGKNDNCFIDRHILNPIDDILFNHSELLTKQVINDCKEWMSK